MKKQSTAILIRPAARGGKYLGPDAANSKNFSALVALMHLETGEIVAHGLADASNPMSAGPADLMQPVSRSAPYAVDGNTVQVRLSVEISEPAVFRVLVFGPLSHPDQARLAQADITVLPGVDIGTADHPEGLVIEVPGLCISNVKADLDGAQLTCSAEVTMMCGCKISNKPDWPWPDSDFSVRLATYMQSGTVYYYPLEFDKKSGAISTFAGEWPNQAAPGDSVEQAWLYAAEPKLGNQGKRKIEQPVPLWLPPEIQEFLAETVN